LSPETRSEFARGGPLPTPLFLECDRARQVVWMSDDPPGAAGEFNRSVGGIAAALSDQVRECETLELRFTKLLALPTRTVIRIHLATGAWSERSQELAGILALVRSMVANIVHLQDIQIRLSLQVLQRGRGSGRKALQLLEMERARLGSELHTGVGQQLTAIGFQLDIIERASAPLPDAVRDSLGKIRTLTSKAHEQARSLSHLLYPPDYARQTMQDLLTQLWELSGIPEMFGAEATLRLMPLSVEPYLTAKRLLYRTAQEALQNVVRHSSATRVAMVLDERAGRFRLSITDNGKGVELDSLLESTTSLKKGIGLRSIREQAYANGGECRIVSGPGQTQIEVTLPVRGPAEEM
jgi:two-component system, NarL family, sensor kinase